MSLDNVELALDAEQLEPMICKYLNINDVNEDYAYNILRLKTVLSNKNNARDLLENYMDVDLEYGILILNHIFPELFAQKRFLNKVRKVLK